MVMVDRVEVSLFEGDGLLVATQVSIITIIIVLIISIILTLIATISLTLITGRQWWILLGCRLFPTFTYAFDFSNFDQNINVIGGSTGGPLVHPSLSAIVITPLACLASKPLVSNISMVVTVVTFPN